MTFGFRILNFLLTNPENEPFGLLYDLSFLIWILTKKSRYNLKKLKTSVLQFLLLKEDGFR